MRLISVRAVLDIEENGNKYAILSHCWGKSDEEVKLSEMEELPKLEKEARDVVRKRPGYKKIVRTCEQARKDELEWAWVDTCCIDKGSSAELHDVEEKALPTAADKDKFRDTRGWPKWFSRGWTLQELIAPEEVFFFNAEWEQLENGTKRGLAHTLFKITGVPTSILQYGLDSEQPCAAQIMSWAANRTTTRVEDRVYSLMGLFGVYMPMLYGEGKNAFRRLQLEILRATNDHSIFAWEPGWGNVLAGDPISFRNCGDVVRMEPAEYRELIKEEIPIERLLTCSVTNAGIQIWLPVRQFKDSNHFEATLACKNTFGPIRIPLAHVKSKHHRDLDYPGDGEPLQFQQLFLAYNEKTDLLKTVFKLNSSSLAEHGFVPEYVHGNLMILTENITTFAMFPAAVSYWNERTDTRFAVVFGSFAGHAWAQLTAPRPWPFFENYAENAYYHMGDAWSTQAHTIAETGKTGTGYCLDKRLHLSCSISDVRLNFQRLPQQSTYSITLDIVHCAGCCMSNDRWQSWDIIPGGEGCILGDVTSILTPNRHESLLVDGIPTTFAWTLVGPGFQLGDYGNWNDKTFEREGNIFDHQTSLALGPVQHEIRHRLEYDNKGDCVKFGHSSILCLRQPRCLSLPDDERIQELVKASSPHLQGKCLVTTVVQCSELHIKESPPWGSWPGGDEPDATDPGWKKATVSVPLFIPRRPLVWCRQGACKDTRAYLEQIRQHFSVLSKPLDLRVPDVDVAVNFLSKLFGGEDLKGYIGDIEFFRRIHVVWSDHTKRCSPVESSKEMQSPETPCADTFGQVEMAHLDLRIESLAQNLIQQMPNTLDSSMDSILLQCDGIAQKAVYNVFGSEVLRLIAAAYQKPWRLQQKSDSDKESDDEFNENEDVNTVVCCEHEGCDSIKDNRDKAFMGYSCIKTLFEQVEKFQTRFDECEDDDEKRTLEEDITGKILLACCRGVYHELAQVLSKVVDCLVHDKDVELSVRDSRVMVLHRIAEGLYGGARQSKSYHLNHLWRITADAQAGVSKYELLLAARKHSTTMPTVKEPSVADQNYDSSQIEEC